MKVGRQGLADARGDRRWGIGASTQPASNQPQLSAIYLQWAELPAHWGVVTSVAEAAAADNASTDREKKSAGGIAGGGDGKSTAVQYTSDGDDDAAVTATAATLHCQQGQCCCFVLLPHTHTLFLSSMT